MSKLVSVIMSAFNEVESDLREAIESILHQSYKNIELIIVNDNPFNQDLACILNEYKALDSRVIIINNEKNCGLAKSLNKAISASRGKYIARMDADDISLLNRIQVQYDYLETHPDCDMVSCNRIDIDEESNEIGTKTSFRIADGNISKVLPFGSIVIHPTVMLRRELYIELGGYNNFRAAQDYDLWLRVISAQKTIHIIPDCLIKYRIRTNSITKSNFARQYLYTKFALEKFRTRQSGVKIANIYTDEEIESYLVKHRLNDSAYISRINRIHDAIHNRSLSLYKRLFYFIEGITIKEVVSIVIREIRFKISLRKYTY